MQEFLFIGLDLAWSAKNNTAAAVVSYNAESGENSGKLAQWAEILGDNSEIVEFVRSVAGEGENPALMAIDAPLVVPNVSGARLGDVQLSQVFRRFEAGTHPANRTNLGRYGNPPGDIRGETLAQLFEQLNFTQSPYLEARTTARQFFECYPHPAMVVLFNLTKTLKYKRKLRGQDNDRHEAYAALQNHLRAMANPPFEPRLQIPLELLARDTTQLKGATLKNYEDLLDSIVCAYVAFYYWWWGDSRVFVFGNLDNGYIVTPISPELRAEAINLGFSR